MPETPVRREPRAPPGSLSFLIIYDRAVFVQHNGLRQRGGAVDDAQQLVVLRVHGEVGETVFIGCPDKDAVVGLSLYWGAIMQIDRTEGEPPPKTAFAVRRAVSLFMPYSVPAIFTLTSKRCTAERMVR